MSALPKTFKAAVFTAQGAPAEIKQVELKPPGDRQVLIKVKASGVCHSDMFTRYNAYGVGFPRIPGHEVVGNIAALGTGVDSKFQLGALVGVGWTAGFCGQCDRCRRGYPASCPKIAIAGLHIDGGHAEYVTVSEEGVALLPEGIDPAKAAPLLCAGITVYNGLRNIKEAMPGDVCVIAGIGGLGHLAIQFANKSGFKTVVISSSSSKKDLAVRLGAHVFIDTSAHDSVEEIKKMGGAKVIIITAPDAKLASSLVTALGHMGTMLILAAINEPLQVNAVHLLGNAAQIRGWPSGSAVDWEDTVKFAQLSGVEAMVETFSLEDYEKAYDRMMKNQVRFRSVITFP
ncbi:GroES-like protein [Gonapodya prolifera JEL478]|uniref:GroES-like protein n=1 Tax=Gonapodya prolifera (strain JEL478) TaxID=1344416 RepID=A0A139AWB7_GONPJ|nr:GroES-like protein [Gonapodya prolifera JEL478]|eukprot:KXS21032.1 GroES-like protein [Gonapodya prolifera JEL478]